MLTSAYFLLSVKKASKRYKKSDNSRWQGRKVKTILLKILDVTIIENKLTWFVIFHLKNVIIKITKRKRVGACKVKSWVIQATDTDT